MKRKKINRNTIAKLLIVFYAAFIAYANFHFHNFDINSEQTIITEKQNSTTFHDPFFSNNICQLLNFVKTKFVDNDSYSNTIITFSEEKLFFYESTNHFQSSDQYYPTFRAPPYFS